MSKEITLIKSQKNKQIDQEKKQMNPFEGEQKKLRVLCLHGFQTNAKIMQYQMRSWIKILSSFVDFECINGKYEMNPAEIFDPAVKKMLKQDERVYSWVTWSSTDFKEDLERDMKFVLNHIEKEGPYDGILGFSQGGGIVNSLIQFHFDKTITINPFPKFFIIINAPLFHLPLSVPQIDVPTLHCVSSQDTIVFDRPLLMTTFYKNPLIIFHSHGHKIPRLEPHQLKVVKKFFLNAVKDKDKPKQNENTEAIVPPPNL